MVKLVIPWSLELSWDGEHELLKANGFNIKRPIGVKNDEEFKTKIYSQEEDT